MARLPRVTARDVIRVLERQGFILDRQKGAHKVYFSPSGNRVTVSDHAGKTIKPKTLKSILREAGWSVEEFTHLMND